MWSGFSTETMRNSLFGRGTWPIQEEIGWLRYLRPAQAIGFVFDE